MYDDMGMGSVPYRGGKTEEAKTAKFAVRLEKERDSANLECKLSCFTFM